MEIVRKLRQSKLKFGTWEARAHVALLENTTHYENGYVTDAMRTLASARGNIQNAIVTYCNKVNEVYNTTKDLPIKEHLWSTILSEELLPVFINDHIGITKKFQEKKIRQVYSFPYYFFDNIKDLISASQSMYPENLKKICLQPIKKEDLTTGWTAILREFGLFSPSTRIFSIIIRDILESDTPFLTSNDIQWITNRHFTLGAFIRGKIQCPAANQVSNHFGLCIALNAGLIKRGMYSPETRILLLKGDNSNHFERADDMLKEYEERLKENATT